MSTITTASGLRELCQEIDSLKRFGLDLEFIPERTYDPELCLVQVATDNGAFIIDPTVLEDMQPLWDRVADPNILVVLHAAEQDLDLAYTRSGKLPQNIRDTQLAAGFIGFGYPVGYGKLLHQILNISISKAESYTDWLKRPLTESQVEYALDDVRHLLPLHDALENLLEEQKRVSWVIDECQRYTHEDYYDKEKSKDFMRIKGASSLNRRGLAVLRALSEWRHFEASRVNKPTRSILQDGILIEFAKHPPRKMADIQRIRGVRPDQSRNYGQTLLDAVQAGLAIPDSQLPSWPASKIPSKREVLMADVLYTVLKVKVFQLDLAPELVATRGSLETLARLFFEGELEGSKLPLLKGWRNEIIGKTLVEVLEGAELRLRFSPGNHPVDMEVSRPGSQG